MTSKLEFFYKYKGFTIWNNPFRIGDLVRVCSPCVVYDKYLAAFNWFKGKPEIPYYSIDGGKNLSSNIVFKIKDIAVHTLNEFPVFYLIDNNGGDLVTRDKYFKPVKIFPLREGESTIIELKRIPFYNPLLR